MRELLCFVILLTAIACAKKATIQRESGGNVAGIAIFPADNPWNTDISGEPVDPNSSALIANCGGATALHPDFGTVWDGAPNGIPYTVVSGGQKGVAVSFDYDDESDHAPYPIPSDAPIEGGSNSDGDRHVIVIDRDAKKLFELFYAFPQADGSWHAASGAIYDLTSNVLRTAGWTSADAAGLPIFPGLTRYDEAVLNGVIAHALRFTCHKTRRGYVAPARHFASSITDPNYPPMGMRVRLRADFDISGYPAEMKVILTALKKYGMLLADNGGAWFVGGAPDARWSDDNLATMKRVPTSALEVVRMGEVIDHY